MDNYSTKQNISISYQNANGVKYKANELEDFIVRHNIDIMLINEKKISNKCNFKLIGYTPR